MRIYTETYRFDRFDPPPQAGMTNFNWIGNAFTSNFGWDVLRDLTEIEHRLAASEGERKGHKRVKKAFKEAGLRNVSEHSFEMEKWARGTSEIHIQTPRDVTLDCIALPGTPEGPVEAEIVNIGYGLPDEYSEEELSGKIVLARSDVPDYQERWLHRREKYYRAYDAGAIGFIYQNHVEGCLPPTGSLGNDQYQIAEIPAVGVSKEVGDRIARYTEEGTVRGTLHIDAELGSGTSQNVYGELGPDTDEEIIVCCHVDGHDISQAAIDNGAGTAIVCDLARIFSEIEDQLETRIRFIGFGAEELGLVGSARYAAQHDTSNVKLVYNCDGIGRGRTLKIYTNRFNGIEQAINQVSDEVNHPINVRPEVLTHSDHWPFVWRGIPGIMVMSETKEKGRGFGHTFADTLDKVDIRETREHAILSAMLLLRYADPSYDIERSTADEIKNYLIDEGEDEWMKACRDWPYDR